MANDVSVRDWQLRAPTMTMGKSFDTSVAVAMKPPRFLVPGDTVKVEIEKIGAIENRVIDEPADTTRF